MGVNGLNEYWVPEHVKDYLMKLGIDIETNLPGVFQGHPSRKAFPKMGLSRNNQERRLTI